MSEQFSIAIVGGGPAGALAAELLSSGGSDVVLFDEKLAWEKPCGGGLTHKALTQYPFLAQAQSESRFIHDCELISPAGRRVSFELSSRWRSSRASRSIPCCSTALVRRPWTSAKNA